MKISISFVCLILVGQSVVAQIYTSPAGVTASSNATSGFVGIGVPSPQEALHVNGSIRGNAMGNALRINTGNGYLDLGAMNATWAHFQTDRSKFYFNRTIDVDGTIQSYQGHLVLGTAGTNRISVLNTNGYMAVGDAIPTARLNIQQSADGWTDGIRLTRNGKNWDFVSDNGGDRLLIAKDQNASNGIVLLNGKVGLGSTSPNTKLELVDGGQMIRFLSGANTSGYSLDVGLNDNGINFSSNSYQRSFNFGNQAQQIRMLTGSNSSSYTLSMGVNDDGINFFNDSAIRGYNFSNATGLLMKITSGGRVGIGNSDPQFAVDIATSSDNYAQLRVKSPGSPLIKLSGSYNAGNGAEFWQNASGDVLINANSGTNGITVKANGNVGMGTYSPDAKLAVNGTIHTKEVKVDMNNWSDYVFNKDYKLRSLAEVQQYIDENHHLPEVPSEKEVLANGQNLGEMNAILLKKIEELTLYVIEMKKEIEQLKKVKE